MVAVSTQPTSSSFTWGGRISPLPLATFYAVHYLRLASPLQWIKFVVRQRITARPTTNLRPDFPSAFTEWYFLALLAVVLSVYTARSSLVGRHPAVDVLLLGGEWLFLVEANVWIFYYCLLRGFLETRYTIFHPAEYLLTLPVVLTIIALLGALISGRHISALLVDAVGNPERGDPVGIGVAIASLFYFGVAITVVLSSHPGIETRLPQNLIIIGAGDVTINRTLPALLSLGYDRDDIVVATVEQTSESDRAAIARRAARLVVASPDTVLQTSLRDRSPTIIASPTYAHFRQLVTLSGAGVRFAVEKPITWSRAERDILRAEPGLMSNGFALSYYTLEKALPLTYLMNPLPAYRGFLTSEPGSLLDSIELATVRERLGRLESVDVELLEGRSRSPVGDSRLWTELPGTLRPFVETTVHPLLVIRHVVGPGEPTWTGCSIGRYTPRADEIRAATGQEIAPTWIVAEGVTRDIRLRFSVGKYVPDSLATRRAVFAFARGTIACDFDARSATITTDGGLHGTITIDENAAGGRYRKNYAVLMSMFIDFSLNGWGPVRFDDFQRQLDALDWWDTLCDRVDEAGVPIRPYDEAPPQDDRLSPLRDT
ncbi:hypothetical protein Acsp01_09780 [Actinoplanes sp. NBRC 101535]|nr:hypothetical protein Acsp01_09780 [Actinoplanes sp. NBRC 101535]